MLEGWLSVGLRDATHGYMCGTDHGLCAGIGSDGDPFRDHGVGNRKYLEDFRGFVVDPWRRL